MHPTPPCLARAKKRPPSTPRAPCWNVIFARCHFWRLVLCSKCSFCGCSESSRLAQRHPNVFIRYIDVGHGGCDLEGPCLVEFDAKIRISPHLKKKHSRQILSHFHMLLKLRAPKRPRSFAKRVRKWAISKERYHTPLCGYAFSRMKSTPHHPPHAASRRHGTAKSLGLLSPPQFTTTTARQSHHHS